MKWNKLTIVLLFYISSVSLYGQTSEFIKHFDRIALSESSSHTDNEQYRITHSGDTLLVADFTDFQKSGSIDFQFLKVKSGVFQSFQIVLKPEIYKTLELYYPQSIVFSDGAIYVLLGQYILKMSLTPKLDIEDQKLIKLSRSYTKMVKSEKDIFLIIDNVSHGFISQSESLAISRFEEERDVLIENFGIENLFYLLFFKRNPILESNGKIYFLAPDSPNLSIYKNDTLIKTYNTGEVNWYSPTEKDRERFNKLAEKHPNRLFSEVADSMSMGYSINIGIQNYTADYFGITYMPGKLNTDKNFDTKLAIYKITDSTFVRIKTIDERESGSNAFDENSEGEIEFKFPFTPRNSGNFYYEDGYLYQINVEPKADWTDRNAKRVMKEQNVSLLNNEFQVCLYIGKIDLP